MDPLVSSFRVAARSTSLVFCAGEHEGPGVTGAQFVKQRLEAQVVIGARITEVQKIFQQVFDFGPALATDGHQFDRLVRSGSLSGRTRRCTICRRCPSRSTSPRRRS
jgi:hypothetical protein